MRQANPAVDPTAVSVAIAVAKRVWRKRHNRELTDARLSGYMRLKKEDRHTLKAGGAPLVKQNTHAAELLVEHCLEFLEGCRNERRKQQAIAAVKLAFGSKAYEHVVGRKERDRQRSADYQREQWIAQKLREWTPANPERGVYVWDWVGIALSVASDGKILSQRRILPHENKDEVVGALFEELDAADPFPILKLVH